MQKQNIFRSIPMGLLAILLSCGFDGHTQVQDSFHVLRSFHIQSPGGWDYLAIQPGTNLLYVSHGTQVNILNKQNGDSVGVIPNTTGVHGIAFIPELNRGYTSNGRLNNITVFELSSRNVLQQIATGENPDAILYEPFTKMIITCNGRSQDLSVIDPVQNKLVTTIPVGGKPETAVSNGAGLLYVNIEDKSEIIEVNLRTNKIMRRWPVGPGEEPTGLCFDKQTNRLFAGCGNKQFVVLDAGGGEVVFHFPIGDHCDGVAFDEATKNIFCSNGEGTLSVFHEISANKFEFKGNVGTKLGARTITLDPQTHLLYLSTAEFEAPKAGSTENSGRLTMIPGTFEVLVVGH